MDWNNFVVEVLQRNSKLDGASITLKNGTQISGTPPVIKVSLDLINRFFSCGEKRIILVFPEKEINIFLFAIIKTINDIFDGSVESIYDPYSFIKGQKLKCRNCVVEFDRIDETNGNTLLWVRDADCVVGAPIEIAPYFQLTDTKRRLSKDSEFEMTKKEILKEYEELSLRRDPKAFLSDMKTHIKKSVFEVAPLGKTKELMEEIQIGGTSIENLLLVGQSDVEGNIKTIGNGQLRGTPAIVLSPNLYSVSAAIDQAAEVSLLLLDVSNINSINSQLDDLDNLLKKEFPIICVTDTVNSFELDLIEQRGFLIWRWDEESISDKLFQSQNPSNEAKLENCANQNIIYQKIEETKISSSLMTLFQNKNAVEESLNSNIISAYDKLLRIAYFLLNNIAPLQEEERIRMNVLVSNAKNLISEEKNYIDKKLYAMLNTIIEELNLFISNEYKIPKIQVIKEIIYSYTKADVCIVIPDRMPKETIEKYWNDYCLRTHTGTRILLMNKNEYCSMQRVDCDLVIVCGWFGQKAMREILFSFNSQNYQIVMYNCEQRWCGSHSKNWTRILHAEKRKHIMSNILPNVKIERKEYDASFIAPEKDSVASDWDLDSILQESQYHQFKASSGDGICAEPVLAIPLNFVGGDIAFFKGKHKTINVTNIIMQKKSEIDIVCANELRVGDFIVIREAEKDIIKEIADIILTNSNKHELISLSQKWKESLKLECCFSNFDQICIKLRKAGCVKNVFTIRQWIHSEDIIAPNSKEDLICIAKAFEDDVLLEKADEVYEACREVKSAHVRAGQYLSKLLKKQIAEKMTQMGPIDPYNIWEAIPLQLPQIGKVEILKIIDIGSEMLVDPSNTNRLISEQ